MTTAAQRNAAHEASRHLAEALSVPLPRLVAPGIVRVPSRYYATNSTEYDVRQCLDGSLLCECPASFNHLICWHLDEARKVFMTTTEVAIRPVVLSQNMALVPTSKDLEVIKDAAKMIFSGKVALPDELKTEQQVAAIMLYGLEMGLRPMTAIRHLYIVNGKVAPSSEVMAGMLMRADPQAKLIVDTLTDELCTMRIIRPSRGIDQRYSVDWPEIVKAGLAGGNNAKYPRDRLRYHCTKRILRIYAPDIINGMDDGPTLDSLVVESGLQEIDPIGLYNEGDEDEDEPTDGEFRNVETATPTDVDTSTGEVNDGEAPLPMSIEDVKAAITRISKDLHDSWPAKDWGALYRDLTAKYTDWVNGKSDGMGEESARALLADLIAKQMAT